MTNQFTHGYALLIAVDESAELRWAMPDVARDVDALREVLVHPDRCAYLSENVRVLKGKEASRSGLLDGLGWLRQKLTEDASDNETAIVYFTGHGLRDITGTDPTFYLRPYDARQDDLRLSALRAEDFAAAIQDLDPRRLLVLLDCCHAGGMSAKGDDLETDGWERIAVPPTLFVAGEKSNSASEGSDGSGGLAQGSGRAVLSSSQAGQLSWIRKDHTMSIFTYHLIEALTGHAQPQEGVNEVLVSDVMSYVWHRVPRSANADWNKKQEPDYQVSGNFPVALLLGGKPWSNGQVAPDPLSGLVSKVTDLATELSQTSAELSQTAAREKELRLEVARIKYAEMLKQENERWENERLSYQIDIGDKPFEPSIGAAVGIAIAGLVFSVFAFGIYSSDPDFFGSFGLLLIFVGILAGVGQGLYIYYKYYSLKEAERAHWGRLASYSFEDFASRHFGLSADHRLDRSWFVSANDVSSKHEVESRNPQL